MSVLGVCGQADLHAGLQTDVLQSLKDLQALAQLHAGKNSRAVAMPVLCGVVQRLEAVVGKKEGLKPHDPTTLYRSASTHAHIVPLRPLSPIPYMHLRVLAMITLGTPP